MIKDAVVDQLKEDAKDIAEADKLGCTLAVYRMLKHLQKQNVDLSNRCAALEEWCAELEADIAAKVV